MNTKIQPGKEGAKNKPLNWKSKSEWKLNKCDEEHIWLANNEISVPGNWTPVWELTSWSQPSADAFFFTTSYDAFLR